MNAAFLVLQSAALSWILATYFQSILPIGLFFLSSVIHFLLSAALLRRSHTALPLRQVFGKLLDAKRIGFVAVPAVLSVQLQHYASRNLSPAVFWPLEKVRLLAVAVFFVGIHKKGLGHRWAAVLLLALGLAISTVAPPVVDSSLSASVQAAPPSLGAIFCVTISALLQAISPVVFEWLLKENRDIDLWARNVQLSAWTAGLSGLLFAFTNTLSLNFSASANRASGAAWALTALLIAVGNLLMTLSLDAADSIITTCLIYCGSLLATIPLIVLAGYDSSPYFILGIALSCLGYYLYASSVEFRKSDPLLTGATEPTTSRKQKRLALLLIVTLLALMLVVLSSQYAGLRDNLVSVPARVTDERVEPVGEESTKLEPVRSEGKHDHPPIEGKEAGEIAKTPHSETNTEKKKDEHLASQDNGKIREKTEEMEKGAAVGSPVEKEKPATGLEPAADNGKGDSVRKPLVEELSPPSINKTLFAAMDMWAHRNVTDEKAEVEYIRYLARTVAINDTLVLIPTNDKFVDQALNLECSLIRHNRPNILFWALDFDAHIQLRALGRRTYYNPALYGTNQAVRYHAPDYNRMMRERPKVWQWFLEAGVSFLWMDADESALGDPFAPLKWDADIEVQVDGFENVLLHVNADSNSTFPVPGWGPCAGLFFLRPTAASITLMQSLRELMLTNQNLEDQQALAHVLLNRNRTFVLQAPPAHNTSPSPEQAREKGLFIARYVDPGKWVNGHPMREKIIYLDKEGKWYYHPRDGQRTFIDKPIVVHVNGLGQKKQFLQGLRAWFLDETNRCRVV